MQQLEYLKTLKTNDMKRTGNTITVESSEVRREEVPVMRNGKPTKRTKLVWKTIPTNIQAIGIEVGGREVFVVEKDLNGYFKQSVCYRKDGTILLCKCKFGRYGQADHIEPVYYKEPDRLFAATTGYDGPCGVGRGAYIKAILWD